MPLATAADVAARWRPLVSNETLLATVLIADVEAILRARWAGLDAAIALGSPSAAVVTGVIARSVVRMMKNPDGKVQESIDDYAYRRADAVADGSLYVSPEDWALILPGRSTVRSVRLLAYDDA